MFMKVEYQLAMKTCLTSKPHAVAIQWKSKKKQICSMKLKHQQMKNRREAKRRK